MDEHQPSLFDFLDGARKPPPTKEEQRKKEKRRLIAKAMWHLKEFYRLLLKSSDKNSVEWTRVSALANKTLKEMEEEGICYFSARWATLKCGYLRTSFGECDGYP